MQKLIVNEADLYAMLRSREAFLGGFVGSLDAKRPSAWTVYGYPENVTFSMLLSAYQRGGPGHGAVHRLLDKCWQELPRIKQPKADEPTEWEERVTSVLENIQGWRKLRDLDRRNMVGRYAAIIYRVADGKPLREPLQRAQRLVDLVPLYEDQLKVTAWNSDPQSDDFGTPQMFQYRTKSLAKPVDTQARPEEWADVHPSRVQILAEGSAGDMFDGVPVLLAGYNALVDLEKICGGSAESYLKNSARTLTIEYDAAASVLTAVGATTADEVQQKHQQRVRDLNRNQDAALITQGGKAGVLQTQTHDPSGAWEKAANTFAAAVQIPMTILFGAQTGRLASAEDRADMNARCKSRQVNELTPMLREFVTRMRACGVLPAGEFVIEWPSLDAPGDEQKTTQLERYTRAMQAAAAAGLTEPLFSANELRAVVDFEPLPDDGMPAEGDPGAVDPLTGDPIGQPGGDPAAAAR